MKNKSPMKLSSNSDPYVSSPFSLPPYESLPPFPSPDQTTPPYCVYPSPASSTVPVPVPVQVPPPAAGVGLVPPSPVLPNPPAAPYYNYEPPPPLPLPPSPYYYSFPPPSGSGFVPTPPSRFLPPIIYPPPAVPPPPRRTPLTAMWCVAKAAVPDPIIQEAMDYACGSGADCNQIQPAGSCFMPNTLFAHASYAFNSYWQRSKVAGGRCDFGGTAILVTVDPSNPTYIHTYLSFSFFILISLIPSPLQVMMAAILFTCNFSLQENTLFLFSLPRLQTEYDGC